MPRSTIVKFRVDDALEAKLDKLAEAKGDRSKALRYAIEVAVRDLAREASFDRLIAQAEHDQRRMREGKMPKKRPWRMNRG